MDRHRSDRPVDRFDDNLGNGSGRRMNSSWSSNSPTERHSRYPKGGAGGDGFSGGGGCYHPYRGPQDLPPPTGGSFRGSDPGSFGPPPPTSGLSSSFSGRGGSPDRTGGNSFAKLFIGSVPRTATEEDIRPLFEEHGNVIEVAFIKDRKTGEQQGCCFVKYASSDEADRAIRALHNQYTLAGGSGPIQVRYGDGDRNHPGPAHWLKQKPRLRVMEQDSDSDAPEEFTAAEGIRQDEEIRKVQRDNLMRIAHEGKERRRRWAKNKTQPKSKKVDAQEVEGTEEPEEASHTPRTLPSKIVDILAAREKQTLLSDSEEEIKNQKPSKRKKKLKRSGPETVLLKGIPPPQCLENSLEFLKRRKMQVSRSSSVLKNPDQAFRLVKRQLA